MTPYTPFPYPNSHHIEGYGLHGPVVDGLLIARDIFKDRIDREEDPFRLEVKVLRDIELAIQRATQ